MKYLVIGGVAGGATAAARLRRNDEHAEIIIFEKGEYISYANCGLPYYIGGTIQDRDRLFVQTPESFYELLKVEVRNLSEVVHLDPAAKQVRVRNLRTEELYEESYDKLILSPGAAPIRPPIPGINSERIFTLRSVPDTDSIKHFVDSQHPRRAVIVGAGFIGLEMAENLHQRGIQVTIVEMADQVMNILDYEMAAEVHQHLKVKNVEFYLKDGVASFEEKEDALHVNLASGKSIPADFVVLSIGVKPDTRLAKEAGLQLGETGGISVNQHLQSSDPDIYALGDAIEFINPILGKPMRIPMAGPANKQGRIVADNILNGNNKTYKGTIGTGIAKVFDLTVASTGVGEKYLNAQNIDSKTVITHLSSHAGYYPGALPMSLKLIFSPEDGKIFGAQIVGYEGVDKRIDMIATLMHKNGTIYDLQEIEHAYAPPFSSAKDPVNILGFIAENILTGASRQIRWNELMELDPDERMMIDVRTPDEHGIASIETAINIPQQEIRSRLSEIPKDKTIVLFCGVGLRAYFTERILRQEGYEQVFNLSGGYKTYAAATQKQSNEDIFDGDFIGKDDHIYQADPYQKPAPISVKRIDASGLQCPGPIMKLKTEMAELAPGTVVEEVATDPGFAKDVQAWANMTGNKLISIDQSKGQITAVLEKGRGKDVQALQKDGASMVVFSDDFDKALASFVIANGAAAAGKEVTMFFTFWGLSIIKKQKKPTVKKGFMGRAFGWMLPNHSRKLALGKMNFGGMGASMMRARMKSLGVSSLEEMIQSAQENGIKFIACQMSMDVMGVKHEELIDGVEVGGVASYIEASTKGNPGLFV
jgi:NADPH-dependent 2,4-dienoyl-CoA reductase/sulfur reductase-like enzyme/peroxiredoxin family protein/TusA-related sulfurtransferase/rhodanese-related sulfurtransferase